MYLRSQKNAFEQVKHVLFKKSEEEKQLRFFSPTNMEDCSTVGIKISHISGTNPLFVDKFPKGALKVTSKAIDYARLISRVHPSVKEDVEKYIQQIVEEKRVVDKRTITELLGEIKSLNAKNSSIEDFGNFIHSNFDHSSNHINEDDSVDEISEVRNASKSAPSSKKQNSVALKKKNSKLSADDDHNDSNKFSMIFSFLLGCAVMLLCIFFESIRNLRRIEDDTGSSI